MSRVPILCLAIAISAGAMLAAEGPRFYPDDPLAAEPRPLPVSEPQRRALSALLETVNSNLRTRGQRHPADGVLESKGVNTLGEVMDGDWYVNRHAARRMTLAELQRGPGHERPPDLTGDWRVLVVKPFGVNPGLLVADARRDLFILRFDPIGSEGLATGAQMVASQFFYALGYHVGENYIIRFDRPRLTVDETGQMVSSAGHVRPLVAEDIESFLKSVPEGPGRTYRAVATRIPEGRAALLGPYQVWGTRSDDPNDTVPHEHRRDLRGMFVFAAWLNFSYMRAVTTQDIVASVDGVRRIRHYVVDLTRSLGSGMFDGPKLVWEGNETLVTSRGAVGKTIAGLGLKKPEWMREKFPDLKEVGAFGSSTFDPETWTTADPLPPFVNRLPDDTFWAARQVMAFTDEEIRAIVQTGQYSKPAEDWITAALIERRNRIGRTYFARVLPLDRIRVQGNTLAFDDLGVSSGLASPRSYTVTWNTFDNASSATGETIGTGADVPDAARALPAGSYVAARIHAGVQAMNVTVYLRRQADGFQIVGLDRSWPGKHVVTLPPPPHADRRAYADLAPRQQELFKTYVDNYNATGGTHYTAEEGFERLTVSEQTTFYGVTHALLHTSLTDSGGAPLGLAIDRVDAVNRIAGQYEGLGGDQQFRIFVTLKPGTRELLEKSREFFIDHQNTVYHVGYPRSYRQIGKEPNMQMSMSEDGMRADIDVDYRSSKSPKALFNGHLTASNSDVRAGDNPKAHNARWSGLILWWQDTLGKLQVNLAKPVDLANIDRAMGPPTPLPPDRPSGASPEKLEDAAQEFLTDWLVRRQYDQALEFLSPQAYACLNLSDDARSQALDAAGVRREARKLMEYASARLGPRPDLTSAIVAFTPRNPDRPITDHPFKREFLLGPVPEAEARQYTCNQPAAPVAGTSPGYYAVVFTFRIDGGGTLGLLWNREGGRWKIVSYQPLVP